jgi:hypothetical protein
MTRRKIAKTLMLLYLLGAVGVLASFVLTPPDDAASLPMAVWTLPAAVIGFVFLYWPFDIAFPFMPSAFGYYGGHLVYFLPAIALIAWAIWRIVGGKPS